MSKNTKKFDELYEQVCNEGGLWDLAKGRFNQIKTGSAVPWGPNGNTEPFLEMFRTFVKNTRSLINTYKEESSKIVGVPAEPNSPVLNARKRIEKLDQFLHNLNADPTGNKGRFICGDKLKKDKDKKTTVDKSLSKLVKQTGKEYLSTGLDPSVP